MASLIPYTKLMLVQRIRQHMANNFPDAAFSTSESETVLYIDQALAYNLVGQVYAGARVEGSLAMPESYLTTYSLPSLQQDSLTGEWYSTLPQPPVSLPLGYSITDVYPVERGMGRGQSFLPIKSKRTAYRSYMPKPIGGSYKIDGSKIVLSTSNGSSLNGITFYVEMAKTRTESINETLNLPDDAIEGIFLNVIAKLKDRLGLPKDIIQDDIGAGNKSS